MHIDIDKIASLAKLRLSADEKNKLSGDLENILGHFDALQEVDTSGVVPTSQVTGLMDVNRNDAVGNGILQQQHQELISSSPHARGKLIELPPVF